MEVDSLPQDVKQNIDAETKQLQNMSLSDPQGQHKKMNLVGSAETNQLQKMSFSDPPQEQNKKDIDGEDGYHQIQKSSSAWWHADDYFDLLSPEELWEQVRPGQEWLMAHTCTSCGMIDPMCKCKQIAILENMECPEPMYSRPRILR